MAKGQTAAVDDVCVVYLARHVNGWEPFHRFLRSYEKHAAGAEHRLLVALKGYTDPALPAAYLECLARLGGEVLTLNDTGFDIGSYWAVGRTLFATSFCFLNSFSVIRDDDWLDKMMRHHNRKVGLVGATGSWEGNLASWHEAATRLLLPPWKTAPPPLPPRRLTLRDRGWFAREWVRQRKKYPPFPNPHIRTNAFLIRRELMQRVDVGSLADKDDTLAFESGRRSLTRQVLKMGLDVLVVGRDGRCFRPPDWPASETFRLGSQANLLVSDRRTEEWANLDPRSKDELAVLTWGRSGRFPVGFHRPRGGFA